MPDTPFRPSLWRDRRFAILLALGFSAGLPLPLVAGQVLRQWFSESNLSLGAIGMTTLIGLAYANKFLWSPALDAVPPPVGRLGRRRGWLLPIQAALLLAIAAVGLTDPLTGAAATIAIAVLVAFLSASQDIVIDALRIEMLEEREQAYGLAAYVWGYRLALLAAGAGTLFLVAPLGWGGAYAATALLMLVGMVATLLAREPEARTMAAIGFAARLRAAVVEPFADLTRRPLWLAILLFVGLFKLGEALAGIMTTPFYRSLGFTREDVATVATVFGLCATLGGALAGGWLVARIGTAPALVLTGLTQMLSNLMYVALAHAGHSMPMLWAQVGVENFTDGLADAAFVTYLSSLTNIRFTATQYALLSSLAAVPLRTLGASSGWIAEALGWSDFFLLTTAAALPAMAIMIFLLRRLPPPVRGHAIP
ncbi:AmpG family muropeptide MFS transporter [Roseomonas hellenica]|uniref:AmpG family muropeptide MFS transporter n=1 Tax=Plastoroseomonas hellenica TaxID=2687306 RepID=A0ABS5EXS1_9PROT|nr:MFS transporter [Plastoroseomonas hellenica]MBR0665095.1 AmpG family muropeptide MFS transporter [Plastoroseomonas hellenica]